jgi:hypothetical protein
MVGELVAQGSLDLTGQQIAIVPEVAFEGVAIDHDPVLVALAGDPVAEVVAVGVVLGAEVGDDHRDPFQDLLELLRQGVDRVGDKGLEPIRLRLVRHRLTVETRRRRSQAWLSGQCPRHAIRSPAPAVSAGSTATKREKYMSDGQSGITTKLRTIAAAFAVLAILGGGAVLSGCGSSGSSSSASTAKAQEEIESGTKKAEEAVKQGTEEAKKGLEEAKKEAENSKGSAKKGIEEGTKQAEKGIEEGTKQVEKGVEEAKKKAEELLNNK